MDQAIIRNPYQLTRPKAPIKGRLLLLLDLGVNDGLIDLLLGMAGVSQDLIDYWAGPIIYHKGSGGPSPGTDWIKNAVIRARLVQICEKHETGGQISPYANDIDAFAYMATATFSEPLYHEYHNIFMWLCQALLPQFDKVPAGEILHQIMNEDRPFTLSRLEIDFLLAIKSKFRRAVMKYAREERKKQRTHGPS
jgi:hypothetical protein